MTIPESAYTIILIIATVILFVLYIIGLIRNLKADSSGRRAYIPAFTVGFLLCVYLVLNAREMSPADFGQTILTLALVLVTGFYALSAYKQANVSAKMAEEMREQRIMESRPVIIQKAVVETEAKFAAFGSREWFSYFEVYNAGNGPAIEVEISLMNKEQTPIHSHRETFLRAGDPPIEFTPSELIDLEKSIFYLVCEYQGILSRGIQTTWYQTWLPFETIESSTEAKFYVKPGELEFKEVQERERIDVFGSRRKPR